MYFLRASTLPKNRRCDRRNICDHSNTSQENFQRIKQLLPHNERNNIKVGTGSWIGPFEQSSKNSLEESSARNQLSRFSSRGQKYFSKSNLKKRLAGVTCFRYNHHTSHLDRSIPSPTLRPHTSDAIPRSKICVSEVIWERSGPKRSLRINVKPSSYHTINDLSPISSFSDDGELRINRSEPQKTKKSRKVTRYHDPESDVRIPRKVAYRSTQRGNSNSVREGISKGLATDKSAVGRHLEWLKFMA